MFDSVAYIADSAATWPLLEVSPSRFGGLEFTVGTHEVGRLYDNGQLDLPLGKALSALLISQGKAEPHHLYPEWASFTAYGKASVHHALWLLRLSYVRKLMWIERRTPGLISGVDVACETRTLNLGHEFLEALAGND